MERCPICEGRGTVVCGFYNTYPYGSTTDASDEPCRTCQGTGIIGNMKHCLDQVELPNYGEVFYPNALLIEIVEKLNDIIKIINEENK